MPAAMDAASTTMGRVLAALAKAGVERKDVQSTGLSVNPEYDYFSYRPPVLTGYRVNQSVSVLVRDLRDGGRAISAATRTGGDAVRVSGHRSAHRRSGRPAREGARRGGRGGHRQGRAVRRRRRGRRWGRC